MHTAITAQHISKRYHVTAAAERYDTLGEALSESVRRATRRVAARLHRGEARGEASGGRAEDFWALRDLTFEVAQGEVVGVIGRNGAGKSTLLKVLSRITEPTDGSAEIHGRIGSLLEVGTGFHHELSGRENVFLNGAILGMRRGDIQRRFDEIVEFAEVSRFIDTPIKRYSSGMKLRLAFAVAAHLEPEILLIDEVLAVGDAAFQRKCLGKMEDVAAEGRTVLFVSHNLGAVKELCRTSIVLDHGRMVFRGPVHQGIAHYTETLPTAQAPSLDGVGWTQLRINDEVDSRMWHLPAGEGLVVEGHLALREWFDAARLFCIVHDASGGVVLHQRVESAQVADGPLAPGVHRVRLELPPLWLAPGMYVAHLKFLGADRSGKDRRYLSHQALIDVSGWSDDLGKGYLAPRGVWEMSPLSTAGCGEPSGA